MKNKLSMEEKLAIANNGGRFKESGWRSWVGTKIRKGKKIGKVIEDWNGAYRDLVVAFEDKTKETISLNNLGKDWEYVHQYEWENKRDGNWYRF